MSLLPPSGKIAPSQPLVYRLCSVSSASTDRYPKNRLTKFIHHLPETIFLDRTKIYVIRLLSVCLSTQRVPQWRASPHVRLHLSQLQANPFTAPDRVRCLAQFVLPDRARSTRSTTRLDWFELSNPTPLILDRTLFSLDDLSFEFTDHKNRELILADDGPPTVVNCIIEEMSSIERFTVTLNPSLSRTHFPSNTDVNFCVTFGATPITIGTDWQVALHSVIVPSGIRVVGEYFQYRTFLQNGRVLTRRHKNDGQTAEQMVDLLLFDVARYQIYIHRTDRTHYKVQFASVIDRGQETGVALQLNPSLCKLFNLNRYTSSEGYTFTINTSPGERTFPYGMSFLPKKVIHPDEQLVLYADIVQSSVFGDDRAPLVDVLSTVRLGMLDHGPTVDTLYSVAQPTFRPVSRAIIKDIRVRITDIHGERAEFEYHGPEDEMQFIFIFQK